MIPWCTTFSQIFVRLIKIHFICSCIKKIRSSSRSTRRLECRGPQHACGQNMSRNTSDKAHKDVHHRSPPCALITRAPCINNAALLMVCTAACVLSMMSECPHTQHHVLCVTGAVYVYVSTAGLPGSMRLFLFSPSCSQSSSLHASCTSSSPTEDAGMGGCQMTTLLSRPPEKKTSVRGCRRAAQGGLAGTCRRQ